MDAIEGTATILRHREPKSIWRTWRDGVQPGQVIFCEVCQRIRFADFVIADVTTLNFNVLFEIGFAIGLGVAVVPVRDATYVKHKAEFEQLGLIDTLKYIDFTNANQLADGILAGMPYQHLSGPVTTLNTQQPIYVVKGALDTDGSVRLLALLKKSRLRYRMLDVAETPRVSLHEVRRQVGMSLGVIAHLLDSNRQGAVVHNARCALIAGLATAANKSVLLLQEGSNAEPIDYRDVVVHYTTAQLEQPLQPFIRSVVDRLQDATIATSVKPEGLLERLDLGDLAAENEVLALRSYFVRTSQYNDARRAAGRIVTGRKGAGKTAIFFAVRDAIPKTNAALVLDLKPEGYQFTKLREAVLDELQQGLREHTLMALWEYVLLCEMAQKVVDNDYTWASRQGNRGELFRRVQQVHNRQPAADIGDFSERLLSQVDTLIDRFSEERLNELETSGKLTEILFRGGIADLENALIPYLKEKDEIWILVDNLDKAWPTRGAAPADILIISMLLEATRKLQRKFEQKGLRLNVLVFLRNDIHELLLRQTSDRGKDTQIALDWNDPELFREIVAQRIRASTGLKGTFDDLWGQLFDGHVGVQHSFDYILDRTLMRPRDLLAFLRRSVETAINRGHERVLEADILKAEESYSDDMLAGINFELRDIYSAYGDLLYVFLGASPVLSPIDVTDSLKNELPEDRIKSVVEVLVWFGFLGVQEANRDDPVFAYQVRYNVEKLMAPIKQGKASFIVHPAFRLALDIKGGK